MGNQNEGARLLGAWMQRREYSAGAVARLIGCHRSFVSLLLSGKRKPSLNTALVLDRVSGGAVPAASWEHARRAA